MNNNLKRKIMKKMTLIRSIATIVMLMVVGMGAFAQYSIPSSPNYVTTTDSVVIGARMPYYIAGDPAIIAMIPAMMNYSIFKWEFSTSADVPVALTPLKYDGSATAAQPLPGYYVENEISAIWSVAAGGYKVKNIERSVPLIGTGCDGNQVERAVVVIPIPTIAFNGPDVGGCGMTTYNVPINLSGASPWKISYTITLGGSTATVTDQVVSNGNMPYTASITTLPLAVNLATAPLTGAIGTYNIVITKVVDRIAEKSLNAIVGTLPGTNLFKIASNPAPVTQPVQHIKNL